MSDSIRVLIVDDDFRVADLHRGIVEGRHGFTAFDPVRSVGEAVSAVRAQRPDLLLVDVYLPDGDGIELVRSAGLDAFVLSAAADAPTVRRALRAGALSYVIKPFEPRTLGDRLDRYARARNLLGGSASMSQETVDRALEVLHGAPQTASMSRTATEQLVLTALGDEARSAADVADRAGVSRATAQRHLAALATRGTIEVRLRYGTTGRPEHLYQRRSDG